MRTKETKYISQSKKMLNQKVKIAITTHQGNLGQGENIKSMNDSYGERRLNTVQRQGKYF